MGFWEENHRGKTPFSSHCTKGICHQHDLAPLVLPWSPGEECLSLSPLLLLFSSLFLTVLLRGKSLSTAHTKGLGSTLWRSEYLHTLFGLLLYWRIVCSPPLICLFNHLFISGWTQEFSLYTLGYNPIRFCFKCSSFCYWELGILSPGSYIPLIDSPPSFYIF